MSKILVAVLVLSLSFSASASAQLCGDADGSGAVTVTDGVQTLRSAAGLSSTCTTAGCDVDGSGSITVTDGVNVLRKAAGIAITESCPGESVDAQVESLLRSTLPVFGALIKSGGSASIARAAETFECDNGDGTFTIDDQTGDISFDNCIFGADGLKYDGFLSVTGNGLDFDITFTDLSTGDFESLSGSFSERASGNTSVLSGFFALDSSTNGRFSIGFDELVVDANLDFIGGAVEFSVDDAGLEDVDTIRLSFNTTNLALVEVNFTDGLVAPFNFDLVSGELTPISN